MTALQTCESLLTKCLNRDRLKLWTDASHRIAKILPEHSILLVDIQRIGRLDCVICKLERDIVEVLSDGQSNHPLFSFDFCVVLATAWLSLTYETLRIIKQRLLSKPDQRMYWTHRIEHIFADFERVRVSELKREIAKGSKLQHEIQLVVPGDEQATAKSYQHGQTVLNSALALRPMDGSVVWHAFSPDLRHSEELYRRDLSDHLLDELLKL